jgi:hypothetical protein
MLSNLALLCRRHHRAVHEEGYQVDRQPDGDLRFRRPDGQLLPEVPSPPGVPANPVQILRAKHDAEGLRLHARTATPGWLGERLDVGWAIDVLHPLASRPEAAYALEGQRRSPLSTKWRTTPEIASASAPATSPASTWRD